MVAKGYNELAQRMRELRGFSGCDLIPKMSYMISRKTSNAHDVADWRIWGPHVSTQTSSGSVSDMTPAPPANDERVMISCSASEAGEKISWSISVSGGGGVSSEINIGISGVISLSRISLISQRGSHDAIRTFHEVQTSMLVDI